MGEVGKGRGGSSFFSSHLCCKSKALLGESAAGEEVVAGVVGKEMREEYS